MDSFSLPVVDPFEFASPVVLKHRRRIIQRDLGKRADSHVVLTAELRNHLFHPFEAVLGDDIAGVDGRTFRDVLGSWQVSGLFCRMQTAF